MLTFTVNRDSIDSDGRSSLIINADDPENNTILLGIENTVLDNSLTDRQRQLTLWSLFHQLFDNVIRENKVGC